MKKVLLTSAGLCAALSSFAQLPVSTTPQSRKVLLEEFTGIHCQYCPDGHKRANELKAAKPAGAVILSNIHTGGYATPGTGEPDYRTAEGNAIAAISGMNISGYPTGAVNRHTFSGQTAMAISRGDWARYADTILSKSSYVNVALQGDLNVTTRVLTVTVQAYYTANATASANNLTVELQEDNVHGPQIDSGPFYPAMRNADGTYTHNHMLRKVLTSSAMGESISPMTAGTTINKTYTYTVPAQFVNNATQLGNLKIIAFIAEGNSEVLTAAEGPINLTGFTSANDAGINTVTSEGEVCAGKLNPSISVYNNGSAAITSATFTYNVNGGTNSTYSYTGSIAPATSADIALPLISFTPNATNTLNVNVTMVNGVADANATNNVGTKGSILLTTKQAADKNMTMVFTQDQYGSESSWKVYEEATGTVVASDGPFANLSASGTAQHIKRFNVDPSKCYKLEVLDSYGDGINAGTGAGGYVLKSSNVTLITSNGQYGKGENKWFKTNSSLTDLAVGNLSSNFSAVSVYPNPARDLATVSFNMKSRANVSVSVIDAVGRVVSVVANNQFEAGTNKVTINTANIAAGIYNVRIQSENGAQVERLSVVK